MEKIFKVAFNGKNILGLIGIMGLVLAIVWGIVYTFQKSQVQNHLTKADILSINSDRYRIEDSTNARNTAIFNKKIDSLFKVQHKVDSIQNYINFKLIPQTNEKIKSIDTLDADSVYKFWSKIYYQSHSR